MANSVIRRNPTKLSGLCISHPSTPKTQAKLHIDNCLSNILPNLFHSSGTKAILSRTRASLAEAEIILRLCQLPYRCLNGSSALHTRPEIGMLVVGIMLCIYGDLRLLVNHANQQKIIYSFLNNAGFKWRKGQLKIALNELRVPLADPLAVLGCLFEGAQYQKIRLNEFATICQKDVEETPAIDVFHRLDAAGLIEDVDLGAVSYADSNDQRRGVLRLSEFLKSSMIDSRTFLDLILNPEEPIDDREPFILSTLHGSKGLEWDNVILIGLHDKEFPCNNTDAGNNEEIEEERRLFYVGITRSKQQLHLLVPSDKGLNLWIRNLWDSTPKGSSVATRFVYESGWSACAVTSSAIYNNTVDEIRSDLSKFHQWYLNDLKRLRV